MLAWDIDRKKYSETGVEFEYFRVPWDEQIFNVPIAQIENFQVRNIDAARVAFDSFEEWTRRENIHLCSVRVPHSKVVEIAFLQQRGFKFVELNYHPERSLIELEITADKLLNVEAINDNDRERLNGIAESIFTFGRFHNDPELGPALGNLRYSRWIRNSLNDSSLMTYKIESDSQMVAFFVSEEGADASIYWWLNGMLPEFAGKGLGKNVWTAMMAHHSKNGMARVHTSISSHNTPILNLYASLGFRFPEPLATLHLVCKSIQI